MKNILTNLKWALIILEVTAQLLCLCLIRTFMWFRWIFTVSLTGLFILILGVEPGGQKKFIVLKL